jgi:hypothetical protein
LDFRGDDNVKGRGGGVIVRSVAPKTPAVASTRSSFATMAAKRSGAG